MCGWGAPRSSRYAPGMVFAAPVWHYWIGVVLALGGVLTVVALVVGYLVKVQAPQYPRRGQRPE